MREFKNKKYHVYPSTNENSIGTDTEEESDYKTIIKFYKYARFVRDAEEDVTLSNVVILPLPLGFTDTSSVNVGGTGQGLIASGIAIAAGQENNQNQVQSAVSSARGFASGLNNLLESNPIEYLFTENNTTRTVATIGARFARRYFPTGIQQITGAILNPHHILSFDGVENKRYNLQWKVSPYSVDDLDSLSAISKLIKERMHPSLGPRNLILDYPHMCTVKFKNVDVSPIRRSFVTGFSIDYGSNNVMNLYKTADGDGRLSHPILATISLQLAELEIRVADGEGVDSKGNVNVRSDEELIRSNQIADVNPFDELDINITDDDSG